MKARLVRGDRREIVVEIDAEDEDFSVIKHDGVYYLYHSQTPDSREEVYVEVSVHDTNTSARIKCEDCDGRGRVSSAPGAANLCPACAGRGHGRGKA